MTNVPLIGVVSGAPEALTTAINGLLHAMNRRDLPKRGAFVESIGRNG